MMHEEVEDGEFLGGQLDGRAVDLEGVRGRVEHDAARRQDGGAIGQVPPGERPDAGEQLAHGERLDHVVIRARLEPAHPVVDRVTGGQHQDRRAHLLLAELPADAQSIRSREHDVHDHDVVGRAEHGGDALVPFVNDVDREPRLAEATLDAGGEPPVVLDQQHSHELQYPYGA